MIINKETSLDKLKERKVTIFVDGEKPQVGVFGNFPVTQLVVDKLEKALDDAGVTKDGRRLGFIGKNGECYAISLASPEPQLVEQLP